DLAAGQTYPRAAPFARVLPQYCLISQGIRIQWVGRFAVEWQTCQGSPRYLIGDREKRFLIRTAVPPSSLRGAPRRSKPAPPWKPERLSRCRWEGRLATAASFAATARATRAKAPAAARSSYNAQGSRDWRRYAAAHRGEARPDQQPRWRLDARKLRMCCPRHAVWRLHSQDPAEDDQGRAVQQETRQQPRLQGVLP